MARPVAANNGFDGFAAAGMGALDEYNVFAPLNDRDAEDQLHALLTHHDGANPAADEIMRMLLAQERQEWEIAPPFDFAGQPNPPTPRMEQAARDTQAPFEVINLIDEENDPIVIASSPPAPSTLTGADCLKQVLEVLPDISHSHVLRLYKKGPPAGTDGPQWIQAFIGNILEGGKYPTEKETQRDLKRKRDADENESNEGSGGEHQGQYIFLGGQLLKDEFPDLKTSHIVWVLRQARSVSKAYRLLVADSSAGTGRLAKKRRKTKPASPLLPGSAAFCVRVDATQPGLFERLQQELEKAKQQVAAEEEKTRQKQAAVAAEEENERHAQEIGAMQECGCCCIERPINRMVECDNVQAEPSHLICFNCIKIHVETEVGQSRCRLTCIHVAGCTSTYTTRQLALAIPPVLLAKLDRMQQDDEIRSAGLDGLEECPFCDYKAICPPIEVDREFRCGSQQCGIVSCRLCRFETHVPLTCEENTKERGIDARHEVEEAMTAALVRTCNKCKKCFVKESGCNKMHCTTCGNMQCYVCGKDVTNYNHFAGNGGTGRCPVNDNTDQRHLDDVKRAEKAALKKVREENPDLNEEDLRIKLSAAVKHTETQVIPLPHHHRFDNPVQFYRPAAPAPMPNIYPHNNPIVNIQPVDQIRRRPNPAVARGLNPAQVARETIYHAAAPQAVQALFANNIHPLRAGPTPMQRLDPSYGMPALGPRQVQPAPAGMWPDPNMWHVGPVHQPPFQQQMGQMPPQQHVHFHVPQPMHPPFHAQFPPQPIVGMGAPHMAGAPPPAGYQGPRQ